MTVMILLIILVSLLILFIFACLKITSWIDDEMEGNYERSKQWKK